jgi:hypothetical protein
VKSEIVDGKLVVSPPEGWAWDGDEQPRLPTKGDMVWTGRAEPFKWGPPKYCERYYILRRTAPDMVAVMLPRDVAEHLAAVISGCGVTEQCIHRDALVDTAREALARTAVLIAGPAGCAEVAVEQANAARCALTAHRINTPTSMYSGGVKAVEAALDRAMGAK